MEEEHGIQMPRHLQIEFSRVVQNITDDTGKEQRPEDIWNAFEQEYLQATTPYDFVDHQTVTATHASEVRHLTATVAKDGAEIKIEGRGTGPIDAYVDAMKRETGMDITVYSYSEHSVGTGSDAKAIAFVEAEVDGKRLYGVGQNPNIVTASLQAITCAVNRAYKNNL
jgi:2-isopropylmalate synthase